MGELTKKEKGRINASLTQSRLGLFDTEQKMTTRSECIYDTMSRCTSDIKSVLDVFLCGTTTSPNYRKLFSNIDSEGVSNIAEICSKLENNPNALNNISIKTVFGGTEHMPFRGLLYLLPALNLCEELRRVNPNINPSMEFLFMNGAGIAANALDPDKTTRTTIQFITVAKKYIETFHQDIAEYANFYVDRIFSTSIMQTEEYNKTLRALEERLIVNTGLKTDLLDMGKRRNASQNSIRYATLHAFTQDGYIDPNVAKMSNILGTDSQKEADIIISIGAKPEEKFFKARKLIASEVSGISFFKPKKTVQYIANINVPPYSPLPTGELYLDEVLKNPSIIEKARARDRNSDELSEYQVPVQKAVESLIQDVYYSNSDKSLIGFVEDISRKMDEKAILNK